MPPLHEQGRRSLVGPKSPTFFQESALESSLLDKNWQLRFDLRGEWPSGLYSLRQVTKVKLGRVRSNSGWVTSEA